MSLLWFSYRRPPKAHCQRPDLYRVVLWRSDDIIRGLTIDGAAHWWMCSWMGPQRKRSVESCMSRICLFQVLLPSLPLSLTYTRMHAFINTCTYTSTHMLSDTHARTCTNTCVCTHMHSQTHVHTHAHTWFHTHKNTFCPYTSDILPPLMPNMMKPAGSHWTETSKTMN